VINIQSKNQNNNKLMLAIIQFNKNLKMVFKSCKYLRLLNSSRKVRVRSLTLILKSLRFQILSYVPVAYLKIQQSSNNNHKLIMSMKNTFKGLMKVLIR